LAGGDVHACSGAGAAAVRARCWNARGRRGLCLHLQRVGLSHCSSRLRFAPPLKPLYPETPLRRPRLAPSRLAPQILAPGQLLGGYAALLSAFCARSSFLSQPPALQAAALLGLTKLMAVDGRMCQPAAAGGAVGAGAWGRDHVALLFTLLLQRCGACRGAGGAVAGALAPLES
jgi:hypothetical protein